MQLLKNQRLRVITEDNNDLGFIRLKANLSSSEGLSKYKDKFVYLKFYFNPYEGEYIDKECYVVTDDEAIEIIIKKHAFYLFHELGFERLLEKYESNKIELLERNYTNDKTS